MSEKKPMPPNSVPEEDLSLHENFAPIIAENGLIRQPIKPPNPDTITMADTVQDLVELRQAEKKAKTLPPQPFPQELIEQVPTEHSFAISEEPKPQVDLAQGADAVAEKEKDLKTISAPKSKTETKTKRHKKHTFLKRLRQARPKKQAAQKAAHSLKTVPQVVPPEELKPVAPPLQKPPKPALPKPRQPKPPRRRWLWVLGILCFLFLGGISSFVPVGRIPLLRNLAYAMGFTPDDTARMSFLRALLTWTDKTIGLPGNWSDDSSRTSLFAGRSRTGAGENAEDEKDAAGLSVRMDRYSGQTSLINIGALHKLQREKGRALDSVRGAVMPGPGQAEAQADPAQLRDDRVVVRTESNRVQSDVYFGSDADAVGRSAQDGYDSSKTLAKVKNPHIADGKPIDWLLNTTQRLMQTNNPLGGRNRQLEGTRVSWGNSVETLGDKKDRKDLYRAWITSRMAKYTSNLMLKKSLADVGFLGAELPTIASMALGGGVQIDNTSFQEDQEGWKEYLEFERKCKEALNNAGAQIQSEISHFNQMVQDPGRWDFPRDCTAAYPASSHSYQGSQFAKRVADIQDVCQNISKDYQELENTCYLQVKRDETVNCSGKITTIYEGHWNNFLNICADEFDKYFQAWYNTWWQNNKNQYQQLIDSLGEQEAKKRVYEANEQKLKNTYQQGAWQTDGKNYTEQKFVNTLDISLNIEGNNPQSMQDVVIDQNGGSSDYFPKEGNIKKTLIDQMQQNTTL